jgi:beta-galactosidase
LAIRLDNPNDSSRWYPGGGIYRNIWLVKTSPVHVAHWGTRVTTPQVSTSKATVHLEVTIENDSNKKTNLEVVTRLHDYEEDGYNIGKAIATIKPVSVEIEAGGKAAVSGSVIVKNPRLWGPPPEQTPNRYVAVTIVSRNGNVLDQYVTPFGIRSLVFDGDKGLRVNGEHIFIKGVNLHHDHGALGGAFNLRAAQRQLEILQEMGCNAIRTAHNPFAPEFYQLTDRMGFLVMDEVFDVWNFKKPDLDFHLIFPEWHEQDLRSMIRRGRNHPSIIMWSFGNEVGEQYRGDKEAKTGQMLYGIAKDEDPTRPATSAMNVAKPDSAFARISDVISLNYQGEGMRWEGPYAKFKGNKSAPQYQPFHEAFPDKVILSSENSCVFTSRGEYFFPVHAGISAPFHGMEGAADTKRAHVSSYELYTEQFGASADKVFAAQEKHPFVAGGFVWTGWDYLGEPSPFYQSRSSYYGIVDLAGFPKNKYYLYQSHWRPDLPMAHILPHWNWPERLGEVTPVHVFTSGDEAELFLNGQSLGRKRKGRYEYRLRWDDVKYEPGALRVVAYRNGRFWAQDTVETAGPASDLEVSVDRRLIQADGQDLAFVTVRVLDADGRVCPRADSLIHFKIEGPGRIVATDNGDPTDMTPFPAHQRRAFNGLCLAVVRGLPHQPGIIKLVAEAENLARSEFEIETINQTGN